MTELPHASKPQDRSALEAADLERVREAAQSRELRRAERAREAFKNHYLGTSQGPR